MEIYAIPRSGAGLAAAQIRRLFQSGREDEAFRHMPPRSAGVFARAVCAATEAPLDLRDAQRSDSQSTPFHSKRFGFVPPEALFGVFITRAVTLEPAAAGELCAASEGIENRMLAAAEKAEDYHDLVRRIKSKRYTETRVRRLVLHAALNLTKQDVGEALNEPPSARVLAFGERGAELLREVRRLRKAASEGVKDDGAVQVPVLPVLYVNTNREKESLAACAATLALNLRADRTYHALAGGSLAGFLRNQKPYIHKD